MATGAEAIEAVAKVTGILPSTVARAARALREAGRDLWPQATRGGGKNAAHVRPGHLVNLALALAVADPITEAAEQIGAFAGLVPLYAHLPAEGQLTSAFARWRQATGTKDTVLVPGDTLGEALAGLVDWLTRPEGAEMRLICTGLHVTLTRQDGYDPQAEVSYFQKGSTENSGWGNSAGYSPRDMQTGDQVSAALAYTPAAILRTMRLNQALFLVLADLWADTQAREAKISAISSAELPLPGGRSETKNAALPGAASNRNQDRDKTTPAPHNPEVSGERENSQPSSSRNPGHSSPLRRRDHHVRTADSAP